MSNFVLKRKYMCLNVIKKGILLTKNIMTGIKMAHSRRFSYLSGTTYQQRLSSLRCLPLHEFYIYISLVICHFM